MLHRRSFKVALQMDYLRRLTPYRVRIESYLHLVAYNLIGQTLASTAARAGVERWTIRFKGTVQTLEPLPGGLGALKGSGASLPVSMLVGVGCGVAMLALLGYVMASMQRLAQSGNLDIESLEGRQGEVTATVPGKACSIAT